MTARVYDIDENGVVDRATTADSVEFANIQNPPNSYPPTAHVHIISEVTGLQAILDTLTTSMSQNAMNVSGNVSAID
ncbi:MAG: hypothetical protein AB8F78_05140 [Saprospiraceae bacterium]